MTDSRQSGDRVAAHLRGFGPLGILFLVVILLAGNIIGTVLVLIWVRLTGTPWREIGYVRDTPWLRTVVAGIAIGVVLKLLLKAIVMPLIGAPPANAAYHYLAGNPAALPGILFTVIVGGGFGEETIWRGYLFERMGRLMKPGVLANVIMVLITSVLFALAHIPGQGLPGAEQAVVTGLVFGTMYALSRSIWLQMIAHAAYDVLAVALIYGGLETRVAHLIFK